MTADLSALIARLEAAEVGSRELDREIWFSMEFSSYGEPSHAPKYSTSLDAALALAERVGWRAYMADFSIVNNFSWMLKSLSDISVTCTESGEHYTGPDFKSGRGKSPALALCIAILRAKQGDRP